MPVSLSEWRVRIGTYVPCMPLIQYHNLVRYLTQLRLFLALLNTLADGENNEDPSEQEMSPKATTDHQSTKKPSKPEKDESLCGLSSDEPKAPTANTDNMKSTSLKEPKKRKRHNNRKGSCGHGQSSGAFLSFRCFLKSGASPLLKFLLLVFTAILLVRSGDVEVNPGPNESVSSGVSDITLIDIAEAISNDMKILRLGSYLRAPEAFIQRCFATGGMSGSVTSKGTHQMLVEWRERTEIQYQQADLREALIQSHLRDVADRYLPGDPPLREEASSEVQNIPIHHAPNARQSTFLGRPNMASSAPFHPVNPNQEAFADSIPMHYQSSHMYAASSTNYSSGHFGYYGGFHSNPHQNMTSMPAIPAAYATPGSFPPSYQLEPHACQPQGQRITPIQPIDPSSSSSSCRQLQPHVMASPQSSTQMDPPSREEASSEAQNVPIHHAPNARQSTFLGRPNMASSTPFLINPNQEASAGSAPVNYQSSYNTASHQHKYAASSTNFGLGQFEYHGGLHSYAHQSMTSMPAIPTAYPTQGSFPPSYQLEPHACQPQGQRITPIQPIDPSSSSSSSCRQLQPHVMASPRSSTQMGAGALPTEGCLSRDPMPNSRANPCLGPSHNKGALPGTCIETTCNMDTTSLSSEPFTMQCTSGHTSTFIPENSSAPSTDCINPITEAHLEKCIADIKTSYRVNLCQVPTSPLDSDSIVELQCIFTNLYLLKEDRNTKKKIPLKYEDLLTVDINGEPAKRIMIQGEAGVGKTTFCAKIAWDWVTGEHYKEYTLVAVVPLREAKNGRTIGQVLKTYLPDDNKVTSEQLDDYIKTNQDKVLTVFDGFDEFGVEMSNGGNQIVQILKGEKHASGRVIVTTRPWKAHKIASGMSLKKQYAFVKIEGFKRKDVKTYVSKFYHDDKTSAQSLLEFMEEGSLITETMAPFPIFCSMLCHMWKVEERREVIRTLQTFSQVFQEMIALLKEHYASKHTAEFDNDSIKEIEKKIDGHFKNISKIAFDGLLSNQLSFQEQVFDSCQGDLHVACEVGLLTKEKTMSKKAHGAVRKMARLESTVSFPHKLFQEYTAGVYLHYLYSSNYTEFDRLMDNCIMRKSREFEYLLYFSGSFDEDICKDILTRLIKWEVDLDLIVEVAFEGHSEEAAHIIEEMQQKVHRSLTIKKGSSLHVIAGYMFTLKNLVSVCIEKLPQSKILSRHLAEKVCSLQTLKELKLDGCNVPVSFSENLHRLSKDVMVETFLLRDVKATKNSAINLAKCICSLPHLKQFHYAFSWEVWQDDFLLALQQEASQSKVESLEIHVGNDVLGVSESASQNLGASICAMPCLKNVKLHVSMKLSDGFYTAFREGASSLKVESLEIHVGNDVLGVSEFASQNLGASICAMPCLKNVKLHVSMMRSDGFYTAFREGASSLKVESLELHGIEKAASQYLGASICAMPCLKNVKLAGNLSDEFFTLLRERASSLKINQLHLMGVALNNSHLSTMALMTKLTSLTLFGVMINDNRKLYEEEGSDPPDTPSSACTSLTELNVDHDSYLSLRCIGLLERFPHIQKLTLAFHGKQSYFPQQLLHHVTMPTVTDLSVYGYYSCDFEELASLSLVPFPNLINLSLINIIAPAKCTSILESLRRKETLETISIKDCITYADFDALCEEINSEGKITVNVEHGELTFSTLKDIFKIL